MSVQLLAGLVMGSLLLALALGIPVAFALMGVGLIFALIFMGPPGLYLASNSVWTMLSSETMLAVPLFVLMAEILEFSGIGESLFEASYKWFAGVGGGLAVAVVVACTFLAAITGVGATGVVIMGVLALPEMEKRGYDKGLMLGCIPAAATLGPIIPPSVLMIILAMMAQQSVARVFMGGVGPGLLISALFCAYILARSALQPGYAPGVPPEERASWKEKILLLRGVVLPVVLILAVLGTIYGGVATATEAAGIGAAGALLIAAIHRRVTWARLKKAALSGFRLTVLIMWIAVGGTLFAGVLTASGAAKVIQAAMLGWPLGAAGMLSIMLIIALIMGCFVDSLAIVMVTVPIFVPVMTQIGVSPVYFVVIYSVAIIIGMITPPFGLNLFYLKGIDPKLSIGDIYRASIPFCTIMIIALFICVIIPDIVMWLPNLMFH